MLGVAVVVATGAFAGSASAQGLPPQEPGVTLRTYQFANGPTKTCTLKSAQTPNVDKLMPNINWTTEAEFGANDNFQSTVLANLNAATAGSYAFRITSDDGSKLSIDGAVVIDHDGLHGDTSKEGTVTLTAGYHDLRIDYIEAGGGQVLKLEWKAPGASAYVVVPTSVLSTEAGVVRVTAPGSKYCEGATDTAGDGLRLDAVNPDYDLTNLRPPGFEPHVSGMDFLPDGRMVMTTSGDVSSGGWVPNPDSGVVYLLDHVTGATNASQVTYKVVADKLRNPMGIQVIGDKYYVSERGQLTELSPDTNGDGLMEKKQLATWPNGGNFHEFAFGLIHDDDYFYIARSNAINNGGATTDPQPGTNPGTFIKVSRSTWQVSIVAGGLRTPNGVGFGPDNDIFVNDNQGAWLPASKMVQIKQDRFFNHYTNPHGPLDDKPVTQPVLWMPQNEIANSPSNPVLVKDGPFKGQMMWGDVTYGGLQRGFLEKVEGEYQGAVFRHSAGLEAGVNRTIIGPDGAIYVGGIGEGGNWGEDNKLRFGFQKLTPNGKNVFDFATMSLVDGGFKLTYTQPVGDTAIARLKDAYKFDQWRYVPTSQYGGPKVDEESLTVKDASISADKLTVTVHLDGLKPGRVVHVRSQRPFASNTGEELWNTEAWYTLNKLPGYVAPVGDGAYELEEATLLGGAKFDTEHAGYTGSGFVSGIQTAGSSSVKIDVNTAKAGDYRFALHYANGPNPFQGPKKLTLIVNGTSRTITLPSTGTWKTWGYYLDTVALNGGANTIEFKYGTTDDGNVNLDSLRLAPAGTTRYEAESGTLAGGANAQTEHPGYSGLGYVGGYQNLGASTTLQINALADGVADVTWGYANGPNPFQGTKRLSLYVNGVFQKKVSFPDTGAWPNYRTLNDKITVKAGNNAIQLKYDTGDEANVNVDYLDFKQNEPIQCGTVAANDTFDGTTLDKCRWTTVLNEDATGYSLAGGKLQIKAASGDITGTDVSAKNIVLQPGPTNGSWAITSKVSIDGTDDYLQAGLVAYSGNSAWGKLVVMRRPGGEWTTELGRNSGYQNGPALPANAQKAITLQMYARDGQLRGRYSLDDGTTWTEVGDGFDIGGIGAPSVGVAAYNGTGAETGTFEAFTVGAPPELPASPPCATPFIPEAGYTALFDGTDASLVDWQYAGSGRFVRQDCTIKSVGGFGLMYTKKDYKAPYSLKLEWMMPGDDNSGIFVGFPDKGTGTDQTSITDGEEIQVDPTDDPAHTTGSIYGKQAADAAARDAALKPAGQWNAYEIQVRADRITVFLNGVKINDWVDPDKALGLGRIGLQMHGSGDDVFFRNVRVGALNTSVDAGTTVGGNVPATLALKLGASASFGSFTPNLDKTYEAATSAEITSTAGDAALTVAPAPAYLANGTYTLSEPLQVAFSKAAWAAPVSGDPVTITLRQHIGANQPLRTGSYSKTLTFTLSTTTP
ncbi:DUF1080 domain-containing protein [Solirubrobacter ginsenosidimutans]|uniref:DUF1080 domain-containing protein n=1 Tax=Solirubrobacter ginsenosidimutans TaxID=490573 RepID=A0A9X3N2P1_9ACTN|nr:family 16 glycoside hydrolase [Solirubrobacter ginsenosidimutans]MDA0165933.1 DUF1080 domain-containing protein [Solirubrobacter ginsenosidimutans]